MKDIKIGLKLITYGLQFKTMLIMFAIFAVMGVVFEVTGVCGNLGGVYLVISGTYIFQTVITSSVATCIASSFVRRKLQTKIPVLFSFVLITLFYTLFVAIRVARLSLGNYDADAVRNGFVTIASVAFLALMIQVYNGFAYKFYIPSLILMLIILIPFMVLALNSRSFIDAIEFSNKWAYVGIGYVFILVGALLSYLITLALQRRDIDPKTYRSALVRAGR